LFDDTPSCLLCPVPEYIIVPWQHLHEVLVETCVQNRSQVEAGELVSLLEEEEKEELKDDVFPHFCSTLIPPTK
jgi:hypothetical protein